MEIKSHAEYLRRANVEEWEIPFDDSGKPYRRAVYVVPPQETSSEEDSGSESDNGDPLRKLAKKYRWEREYSSEEEDIPLAKLAGRLKAGKQRLKRGENLDNLPRAVSDRSLTSGDDEPMLVDYVGEGKKTKKKQKQQVQNLLQAIVDVL